MSVICKPFSTVESVLLGAVAGTVLFAAFGVGMVVENHRRGLTGPATSPPPALR